MSAARDILLVGGDGFLGSHVVEPLRPSGARLAVLSRGRHRSPEGVEVLRADRRDPAALARVLGGRHFDLTVDLAAYDSAGIEALWSVPGLRLGRAVTVSTGQVYLVTERPRPPFREPDSRRALMPEPARETPDHAEWSYGIGKRAVEAALMALRRHHGARVVILRVPVLQGEGDPTLRLWAWLERMLDGGPVLLPDTGRRATRFLDVRDAAALIARFAAGEWPKGAVYNLAAPRTTTLRRFLALAARAAGVMPRFVPAPARELVARGLDPGAWPYAGHWSSVLDASRARRDLGFEGTPPEKWVPRVVRAHLERRPARSHAGYAQRELERRVGEELFASARASSVRTPGGR